MAAELVERIRQAEREAENIERQGDAQASARRARPSDAPRRKRPRPLAES